MSNKLLSTLESTFSANRAEIQKKWISAIRAIRSPRFPEAINNSELQQQTTHLLDELASVFAAYPSAGKWEMGERNLLRQALRDVSEYGARIGFTPAETSAYLMSLKSVLTQVLLRELAKSPAKLQACIIAVDDVIGQMALVTFAAFVDARERIIAQQSASLIELATPVVRLWDRVLLLPLVGVIDTARARAFTENLLEAITRFEATVTIIDVTGVPMFDTAVARHLMKSVDAAQLLGSKVVMTGLSPEGALTLTKLGITLPQVITRATLRSGVAEALGILGKRIVTVPAKE